MAEETETVACTKAEAKAGVALTAGHPTVLVVDLGKKKAEDSSGEQESEGGEG